MPNEAVLQEIEISELIQAVDDGRAATDRFKLLAVDRTELDLRLANLKATDAATLLTEGDRAGASAKVRAALDALANHLRDGFNFVRGIGSYAISAPDRLAVFTAYGWEQGEIGNLSDARIEALANQAITATPSISDPAWRYPAALLTLITNQLAIVNANQPLATGGTAQAATAARDLALGKLQTMNDRIRFFYCSPQTLPLPACGERVGVRGRDQTPELAKIGKQPRRDRGEAEPEPFPDPAGTTAFDAATSRLSVPALPLHATSLRTRKRGRESLTGTARRVLRIKDSRPLFRSNYRVAVLQEW
jgi:hypothetical protein